MKTFTKEQFVELVKNGNWQRFQKINKPDEKPIELLDKEFEEFYKTSKYSGSAYIVSGKNGVKITYKADYLYVENMPKSFESSDTEHGIPWTLEGASIVDTDGRRLNKYQQMTFLADVCDDDFSKIDYSTIHKELGRRIAFQNKCKQQDKEIKLAKMKKQMTRLFTLHQFRRLVKNGDWKFYQEIEKPDKCEVNDDITIYCGNAWIESSLDRIEICYNEVYEYDEYQLDSFKSAPPETEFAWSLSYAEIYNDDGAILDKCQINDFLSEICDKKFSTIDYSAIHKELEETMDIDETDN